NIAAGAGCVAGSADQGFRFHYRGRQQEGKMKTQRKSVTHKVSKRSMSQPARVPIRKLPTGVRGLDEIMGGGLPELSFNIITGGPGCGKTTLAHQILFANATRKKPALYFTILGE